MFQKIRLHLGKKKGGNSVGPAHKPASLFIIICLTCLRIELPVLQTSLKMRNNKICLRKNHSTQQKFENKGFTRKTQELFYAKRTTSE